MHIEVEFVLKQELYSTKSNMLNLPVGIVIH